MFILPNSFRRPDGSVGMAFVLPALTDPVVRIPAGPLRSLKCDPPKGTGADHKKSSSLILLCIVLCSVFRSVPLGRVSLACLGCPCSGWPLPVRFSCGFLPCGLARSLLASPPFPPPWLFSGAFWSSQSCWSLRPDFWLCLQRSSCHTFGMACRD